MSKEILIARPNAFIVKNMKQLLQDCGKQSVVLDDYKYIDSYKNSSFSGVVISTTVASSMNASFEDVLSAVLEHFKGVPILLPTLLDAERAKKALRLSLLNIGSNLELISIEEVIEGNEVELKDKLLVLQKKDIASSSSYNKVVDVVKKFFN